MAVSRGRATTFSTTSFFVASDLRFLLALAVFVRRTRLVHALAVGDFGHGDFPPPAALLGRPVRIGLDAHDVREIRDASVLMTRLLLAVLLHVLGECVI